MAWLVSKGYTHKYGFDFQETLSPVVKMATVMSIISIGTSKD